MRPRLGVRWTIGDVNPAGFEALRLSVHGAMQLFGTGAEYRVYVNTIALGEAQRRTGATPPGLQWEQSSGAVPAVLESHLDRGMAEGVAWKLTPLRAFPECHELSLDNDVILWRIPRPVEQWLASADPAASLIAADIKPAFGQFAALCGEGPRNSGIRGLGPDLDFEASIANVLRRHPVRLQSELDEQGLQVAALTMSGEPYVVETSDVTICSPFYPHSPGLGDCGAHFVGLNTRHLPWSYYDRPATEVRLEHWLNLRAQLYARVGLPFHADHPVPMPGHD